MKKIIYKNLATDFIKFFLLTIFTIGTIIWVLQAVNYLDFVIEDGHGFLVYFNYTLLSFPKIFSKIFPFAIFLTFSYILLKYENKNELVIFWNFGIKKITFINFFIKFSFIFVLLSLILNAVITPLTQNKARSFIRSSDLDFFASILKPKKFIDVIVGITIYFDEKTDSGKLKNIFLNDGEGQTTFAKSGELDLRNGRRILILRNGKTINNKKGIFSQFEFTKSDFNITKFNSKTITQKKTQENSTIELYKCLLILETGKKKVEPIISKIGENCKFQNLENIYEELYTRLIKPFYITFLISISLLLILKSKQDHKFRFYKFTIFLFGFLFIIFLESSSKFIGLNILQNLIISTLPFIFMSLIYFYFLIQLKINKL